VTIVRFSHDVGSHRVKQLAEYMPDVIISDSGMKTSRVVAFKGVPVYVAASEYFSA
jgi:hypothetical protein